MRRPVFLALVAAPIVALVASTRPVSAQDDRYAPVVVLLPTGARAQALGGANVALRDAEALFGNPALVGAPTTSSLTLARYSAHATSGVLASTTTYGPLGVGIGVQFLDYTTRGLAFPPSSRGLTSDDPLAASSLAATVAASLAWKGYRWGASAKFVGERAAADQSGGAAFDLGVSRELLVANAVVAVAVQNIGDGLELRGSRAPLPLRAVVGASAGGFALGRWVDAGGTLQLAVDRDGVVAPGGGVEVTAVPIEGISFTARAGARRPSLDAQRPLTGGLGFSYDRLTLDYGWEHLRGGAAHRLTLRLR